MKQVHIGESNIVFLFFPRPKAMLGEIDSKHPIVLKLQRTPVAGSILFNSLQFILYCPQSNIRNLPQRALQSVHIRHPCPRTSQTPHKNCKILSQGKKGRNLQESNIPLPGWTEAKDVMCTDEGKGCRRPTHQARGIAKEARPMRPGPLGRRDREGGRVIGKEARSRPWAGCSKQGQGVRTQEPGPARSNGPYEARRHT